MSQTIYLDYNATTPINPEVLKAMMPYLTHEFGNAASVTHRYGWVAKEAVVKAQQQMATLIGAEPGEITFTSGATDAINQAIVGVYELFKQHKNHFITVNTEHKAVLKAHYYLEKKGASVTYLSVCKEGKIDLNELENNITDDTAMVSIMLANNETGVVQNIKEISEIVHRKKAVFFCDAVQSIGKMNVNVNELGIDVMPVAAHKFYGPKGVGALYLRRKSPRVRLVNELHTGTLNVAGIVGMGKACEMINNRFENISSLKLKLWNELQTLGFLSNVPINSTLCNTLNIRHTHIKASTFIKQIPQVAFALGAACNSENTQLSHVLKNMGLSDDEVKNSLRLSLGVNSTEGEINNVISFFKKVI